MCPNHKTITMQNKQKYKKTNTKRVFFFWQDCHMENITSLWYYMRRKKADLSAFWRFYKYGKFIFPACLQEV